MARLLALLLTVLTGFTGLVYEVSWQRYLATLLGSHSEATAAVLGLFLAGLSAGYSLFGAVTRRIVRRAATSGRPPPLLAFYGLIEAAIGAWALAFPALFEGVRLLSYRIPHGAGGVGFGYDVVLSALLVGPPTVLMGGTIPILTQALARSLADATRFHAFVYACNTAGAFAGALAAGFFLVPTLGLIGVLRAMGALNLLAGAAFAALGRCRRPLLQTDETPRESAAEGTRLFAVVALLSGFAMMAVQTVLIRLGGLSFGASQFTFSMVVAVFVLCIALGSFAVSALPRIPASYLVANQWGLFLLLFLLYGWLSEAPYWAYVLRTLFRDVDAAFYPYYALAFVGVLALIGPPVLLSGALLPLLFHHLRGRAGELGAVAGRLYAWNTVGSLLGALLGGYALLHWLDLHHVYRIAMASVAVGALLLTMRLFGFWRRAAVAVVGLPMLGAVALLNAWDPAVLSSGFFRSRQPNPATYSGLEAVSNLIQGELRFYDDDPVASVSVMEIALKPEGFSRAIVNNGKSDGNTLADYPTMGLAAVIPALLADRAESAFVIGFGTGVTVGELASLDSMREVVVAEISPGVIEAAPLFDFANLGVSRNPKVRIVQSDAYRALMRSRARFDVIVSEPSNPWVNGVEMLFSREFLEAARSRLSPGGVFAQWHQQYETDVEALSLVLRTYASVFDQISVWYGKGADLILLGFARDDLNADLPRLERRASRPGFAAALKRSGVESLPALLAHELIPLGVVNAAGFEGPLHTLYHPRLSHLAGLAFFRGFPGELPFTGFGLPARLGGERSLAERLAQHHGGELPEPAREALVREACTHRTHQCATLLARWRRDRPDSPALAKATRAALTGRRRFGGPLSKATLQHLEALFQVSSPRAVSVAEAEHATQLYTRYYQHAAPFDPQALLDLWARCRNQGRPARCSGGLRQARALLTRGQTEFQASARRPYSVGPARPGR